MRATLVRPFLAAAIAAVAPLRAQTPFRATIDAYRSAHEVEILRELGDLLAIPNLASDSANIRRNAAAVQAMLTKRGIATRLLESPTGGPPAVYGELRVPGATRTVVLYAHYDGQPVEAAKWATPPWEPTVRDGPLERGGRVAPFPTANGTTGPEWRLNARWARDDKAPILAMLVALDALRAAGTAP
ncbi:MAG: peptidase M20, partial [Gemmatimonadaceae bacterium]